MCLAQHPPWPTSFNDDRGIGDKRRGFVRAGVLQWGRDQLIAEFFLNLRMPELPIGASMRPRSADRGISRHSNYSIINDLRYGQREAIARSSLSQLSPHLFRSNHCKISCLEAARGSPTFRIDPPLASAGNKNRVLIQLSFQNLG